MHYLGDLLFRRLWRKGVTVELPEPPRWLLLTVAGVIVGFGLLVVVSAMLVS